MRGGEVKPDRVDAALRGMSKAHGMGIARRAPTILKDALAIAVLARVLDSNPIHDRSGILAKKAPQGARQMTVEQLRPLLIALRESLRCAQLDLAEPVIMLPLPVCDGRSCWRFAGRMWIQRR